jgi:hypothetical protein
MIFRKPYASEVASWSFLTNHARVLLCVAHDPGVRLRDIAAAATQLDEERITHAAEAGRIERAEAQRDAATARAGAEPERIRADSTRQREELRQVLDGRASVLEEARAELRARAGRAGRELDHVRAERAEVGRA